MVHNSTDHGPRTLGRAIRALRHQTGLTQKELAERVGTSEAYISNVEGGRRDVRWSTLKRLLAALDATLADLEAEIERDGR